MPIELNEELSFPTGCIINRKLVVIASELDSIIQKKPHTQVLQYQDGKWSHFIVDWPIISMCVTRKNGDSLFSLGVDGRVHIADRNGFSEEVISGPERAGTLSQIKLIGDHLYAVGMGRQVYKRENSGEWSAIDQGIRQSIEDDEIRGILSIDGRNSSDIYAVGYEGEIFHYNGKDWAAMDCPTNADLHCIKYVSDDLYYIVGQQGTILKGVKDRWEVVKQDLETGDLWSISSFLDDVYFSSDSQLIKISNKEFKPVNIGLSGSASCGHLDAADGVLWSFGTKFLSYFDGEVWHPVEVIQ